MSIQTINSMITWVESNITENPTLIDMSNFAGYSSYYCSSRFHDEVGMSFKTYVKKRKLSLAAHDLLSTHSRIIDIAFKYGFSSNEAFTRAFKLEYSYTPSTYRKNKPQISQLNRITI